MLIEALKRIFLAGSLMFFFIPAYSQSRLVSFDKELQILEKLKNTHGVSSIEYADQLANMAIVFQDTTYHDYYNQLSKIIVANHWTVREQFGIDSEVYRILLCYLSHTYTFGRFFNTINLDYKPFVRQLLLSLEDKINYVKHNEHEFYSLISSVYQEDKDYKNVIKWRKKAIEKIGKTNSIDKYFYDNEFLAGAYYHTKQTKLFQKTASILFADEDISDEQKQMAFSYLIGQITLSNDEEWDEESARFLLNHYMGISGLDLSKESIIYIIPAKNGDLKFLKLLEEEIVENDKMSLEKQFEYYYYVSIFLSQDAKDQKSSIEYCLKAIDVMEKIGTCESRFLKDGRPCYSTMGFRYEEDQNYQKAIEYYVKGLEDIENCHGMNNEMFYFYARTIAADYSNYLSDSNQSLYYYNKALASAKQIYGTRSKNYLDVAIIIIGKLRTLNRFDEAKELCDSTISLISKDQQLKDYLPRLYNQRGLIASNLHYTREAVDYFNKAVETAGDINEVISFLLNREQVIREQGLDTTSDLFYIDSLINKNPDVNDNNRFHFYYNAAITFSNSDQENAKRYYDLADYYSKDLIPHRRVAFRLSQSLSEPNQAKRYSLLLDAINIFENNQLKDSMLLADVYTKLASYYEDVQDYNNAILHYDRALRVYRSIDVSPTNPSFLACMNNYSLLASSVDALKVVYEIRKDILFSFSPELRSTLINLITVSLENGNIEFADSLFRKDGNAILIDDEGIFEHIFLEARIEHKKGNVIRALEIISTLEKELDKFPQHCLIYYETLLSWKREVGHDIYDIWKKLLRFYKSDIISKLLYYSNSERKNLLFGIQYNMNELINDGKNDSRFISLIANYSLFSKGLLLTTGHQIQKILRKDKTAQHLYRECRLKRVKRKSLSPSDSVQISSLDREISLLDKQISDRVGPKDLTKHLSYSASDLLKTIGNKQMTIDFILTESDSIGNYYAMIYRDNKLYFIPLFSKKDLARYEAMGESGINAMSKPQFGKLIWGKLLPYMKDCKSIYFSPVSSLNKFAIELLPILADSVPDISFHRVLRLEKEMFSKSKKVSTQEIVAFGNIDYDQVNTKEATRGQSSRKWGQLYATEAELKNIQEVYPKSHLGFYEKADASEGNFKNLDNKEINILHLATHGFYLSDLDILAPPKTKYYPNLVSASGGKGRGGLLLCGANYSWYHAVPDSIEDGILTTEEIEELSFDNLELVVQSACETGLGENNTDGVWGLQRAFRIAGANRQIVSLLRVDDERTKEFMGELHKNISNSKDVYESYRIAQSYMFNKYKSNPRFWASFILLE